MTIPDLISAITTKHQAQGITVNPPASEAAIARFGQKTGCSLPPDFKDFYSCCNGFSCSEDDFNILSLEEITTHELDYGKDWFYFAEYMIHADVWGMRKTTGEGYEIFNGNPIDSVILTHSLTAFLERFLHGNVFDKGGLYDWEDELKAGKQG